MTQLFECKVRYTKTVEGDLTKKVTETYLVEALSFTEAEARFLDEIEPFVGGQEFEVSDIKRARVSELFESADTADDRWFRAKVAFVTLDEKTGQEKRSMQNMLVQAADLRVALANLDRGMGGTLADYVIVSLAETAILDLFRYKVDAQ